MDSVTLMASDGRHIIASRRAAEGSTLIKDMLGDLELDEASKPILIDLHFDILTIVMEWCELHMDGISTYIYHELHQNDEWVTKYLGLEGLIIDIMKAANFLEIEPLLELSCKSLADVKSAEGVQELLGQEVKILIPELAEKILDYVGPISQNQHYTRCGQPNRESSTLDLRTRYGYFNLPTDRPKDFLTNRTELWMTVECSAFTAQHLRRNNGDFLLDTEFSKDVAKVSSCLLRVDEKISRDFILVSEKIIGHELRNIFSAANSLTILKLAGVRPSEAIISMIRDAQVQFLENTGRTVRITFFAPAWDKPNMEKLRPPPLDRVLKGKQEYKNAQRRMAAAFRILDRLLWSDLRHHRVELVHDEAVRTVRYARRRGLQQTEAGLVNALDNGAGAHADAAVTAVHVVEVGVDLEANAAAVARASVGWRHGGVYGFMVSGGVGMRWM
ncbi:hypothetical protein V495_00189 [Pseudogymnoascus sp. VKM F-4514 (FW-929)]|nr:hypothetical protein V495_00189 [Pseudogymnoascus sp. VKM F-4514 (FW-929)]KFY67307.1 hypothetical protein V497_00420 [Pseudogymnoascus sp. VKM F-4516 (FW-969)]